MFCIKCGHELEEGAEFCGQCGTKIVYKDKVLNGEQADVNQKYVNQADAVQTVQESEGKKIIPVILAAAAVLTVVLIAIVCISLNNGSAENETSSETRQADDQVADAEIEKDPDITDDQNNSEEESDDHIHNWIPATCTEPKTCSECGASEGEAQGHNFMDATCTEPKICSACGLAEGEPLGHLMNGNVCERCGKYIFDDVSVGNVIFFGSYEQDGNPSNGAEVLVWKVLAKENDKMLVITEKVIDRVDYDSGLDYTTWEDSEIRDWCNDAFYRQAFSEAERSQILEVNNSNPDASGYEWNWHGKDGVNTRDKVFCLSYEEYESYLLTDDDRAGYPSVYAVNNGVSVERNSQCCWWLRSPGIREKEKMIVVCNNNEIKVYSNYPDGSHNNGVRPAMWISL